MSIRVSFSIRPPRPPRPRGAGRSGRTYGLPLVALLATLAICLAACDGVGSDPLSAASVDGHPISMTAYQRIVDLLKVVRAVQGQPIDWQSPQGRTALASAQAQALSYLTQAELIDEKVQGQRLKVSAKDVGTNVQSLSATFHGWAQQVPSNAQVSDLVAAAAQAEKAARHAPSLSALLAGRPSVSDSVLILALEQTEGNLLYANAKVPTAHVRLLETSTQQEANRLKTQVETHKADFGQLLQQHPLDLGNGPQNSDFSQVYVGELSQLAQPLDPAIFGKSADYRSKTSYVVVPLQSGKNARYALCEVSQRDWTPVSKVSDPQMRSQVFNAWLAVVVQPAASIQQYVAVDPTPTAASQAQQQG
jgi:hypothetical protein